VTTWLLRLDLHAAAEEALPGSFSTGKKFQQSSAAFLQQVLS